MARRLSQAMAMKPGGLSRNPGYAYNYLQQRHGLSPNAAAGIVDNLQVESGFADDVLDGRRRGDDNTAAYVAQWRGDRLRNFEDLARQRNALPGTPEHFDAQLDFIMMEMDPNSPYADSIAASNRSAILNPQNRRDAAIAFARHFERPAAQHIAQRPGAANIPGLDYEAETTEATMNMTSPLRRNRLGAPGQFRTQPANMASPPAQGLFANLGQERQEQLQGNLADYFKMMSERQTPQVRSRAPAPQNTFISAAAQPWLMRRG